MELDGTGEEQEDTLYVWFLSLQYLLGFIMSKKIYKKSPALLFKGDWKA